MSHEIHKLTQEKLVFSPKVLLLLQGREQRRLAGDRLRPWMQGRWRKGGDAATPGKRAAAQRRSSPGGDPQWGDHVHVRPQRLLPAAAALLAMARAGKER